MLYSSPTLVPLVDRNSKALFVSSGAHPLEPPSAHGAGHRAPSAALVPLERPGARQCTAWLWLDRRRGLG
jgi:hypothetical protein